MGQESLRIKMDIGPMYRIENNFYLDYGFLGHNTLQSTCGCQHFGEIYCFHCQGNLNLEAVWFCERLVINYRDRWYHNVPDHSNGPR